MWQSRVEDGAVVAEVPVRFVGLVFDLGGEAQWGLPRAGVEALFHGHLTNTKRVDYSKQLRSLWIVSILLKKVPRKRKAISNEKGRVLKTG